MPALTNVAQKVMPGQMVLPYLMPQGTQQSPLAMPKLELPNESSVSLPAQAEPTLVPSTTQQSPAPEKPLNAQNEPIQNAPLQNVSQTSAPAVTQAPTQPVEQPVEQTITQPAEQQPTNTQPTEDPSNTQVQTGPRKLDINDFLDGRGDLGEFLESYIREEQKKQRNYQEEEKKYKREKIYNSIGDAISALSSVFFATQGAPNMFDPKNSMTAKAQERYDKMIADRDKSRDNIIKLAQLKDSLRQSDNNTRLAIEQFNQQAEQNAWNRDMQEKQYKDTKENTEWQKKMEQDKFDFNKETTQTQLNLSERQVSAEEKRLGMSYAEFKQEMEIKRETLALEKQKGTVVFALGDGQKVNIPSNALNNQTVGYLFNLLPEDIRKNVHGKAHTDNFGEVTYAEPDIEDKTAAIGAYLGTKDSGVANVRKEVQNLAANSTVNFGVPDYSKTSSPSSDGNLGVK